MNIGILYCGYNQLENVKNTLQFWNSIKIDGVNFIVCNVSVPFVEYIGTDQVEDGTIDYIKAIDRDNLKHSIFEPKFVKERIARNHAMELLFQHSIDFLWQVDSDEYYSKENVSNIIEYLKNTNNLCYSVNFKNYIFDGKHYLDEFCPPKINRVGKNKILSFYNDNGVVYQDYGIVHPTPIPKEVAWVKHMTWLHSNGKSKVEYQLRHFGDCGYKWNSIKNELELDVEYFKRHGYRVPTVLREE